MSISIFHIPHLREDIALNLHQRDLTRCVLVSKEWNTWFTPTLWFNPRYRHAIKKDDLTSLIRHQNWVRSIHNLILIRQVVSPSDLPLSFPRLQSIQVIFDNDYNDLLLEAIMSMVKRTPTLQSLSVTQSQYFVSYRPMLNIIQNHRGLRRFSLKSTQEYYLDHVHEIIEACSKIDYLHLDLWRQPPKSYDFHGRISERSATAKDRFRRMQYTKFRELNLELHNESMAHDLLISLIERCPLLEKLSIAGRFKSTTLSDLSTILQTGVCPSLSALELGDSHDTRHGPGDLATLIRSIGCGSNNKGINNGNGSGSGGLEALSLYNGTRFGPLAISALTQCHAKTLTTLRWPQLTSLNLSLFGDILKGLPRLQTLQARVWLNLRVKDGPDMDRVFEKQWNCPDLINLELDLGLSCNFHSTADPLWKGSLSDRCMTYVFSQIARLVTLKKLEIRSEVALLILREPGYLGMLSGLKQLESLRFDRWESFEIGAEDAKWMIENWPKLSQVVEIWRLQGILPQSTRGRALEEFTQTLVTLRPWLRTT